ncbi:DMT family transporter [Sinomicrobium weinanense]|uniref:Multidrug efflux SMR transporter n=1 Tax=Sinomicrobium weinanense TaxID=2842200 RepID=A0A926JWV2_9FLAO|nr:multidrug efflux SMR transporter [Sinomicrobium weinanense]MBC9798648.1 multidrug efflux SMR transporter [Sinomicrobium weinanense]MBU3122366.1 multidrug efflux SMR transporter [Sinomicrobium weinanense]
MKYIFLLGAIVSEIIGGVATRQSSGFTRIWPSIIAVFGVVGAYYFLSLSLKHGMGIGVAYGIWAAVGITLMACIGAIFFKEQLGTVQVIGLALIIVGVLALEWGGKSLT